jgi:hypothetical protein
LPARIRSSRSSLLKLALRQNRDRSIRASQDCNGSEAASSMTNEILPGFFFAPIPRYRSSSADHPVDNAPLAG